MSFTDKLEEAINNVCDNMLAERFHSEANAVTLIKGILEEVERGERMNRIYHEIASLIGDQPSRVILKYVIVAVKEKLSQWNLGLKDLTKFDIKRQIVDACARVSKYAKDKIKSAELDNNLKQEMMQIIDNECRRWTTDDLESMIDAVIQNVK